MGKLCRAPEPQRLTQKDKDAIVAKHNELRSKVALGNENRGSPGPLPKASNMQKMVNISEHCYILLCLVLGVIVKFLN